MGRCNDIIKTDFVEILCEALKRIQLVPVVFKRGLL
jgi:hypothetical protein